MVNIYIYSDESGVFDKEHNKFFVFAGIIILGSESKEEWSHKYAAAEKVIRNRNRYSKDYELKATRVSNEDKGKLYRSLNNCYKFGVIINQQKVLERIFKSKKDKQRYLDFAYKIAVKRALQALVEQGVINITEVKILHFYVDEHTTATNGRYELREGLEKELKNGTYNMDYNIFYPPIFPCVSDVQLNFCNSASTQLVRAADIVANRIYHLVNTQKLLLPDDHLHIERLP